ncbi:tannase/feruloyl esterase family alpha/beta hydrolase [Hydrogenophaga laconesensis]|uniref:Feruloyl esterase n=1 Tax=Hydrogenophaga laconesensis TaxID=1805971 RepID=A0ABU1VFK5_9BURK|nr:tannase/feruloyl esterase family alpha/beta hydrolase [Hydrogenophaga laconesensis]MDR7096249.1 feruloyl esterase [Hydrogenophaga laconesensis]
MFQVKMVALAAASTAVLLSACGGGGGGDATPPATPEPSLAIPAPGSLLPEAAPVTITAADCTAARLGTTVASADIGEPVAAVTLNAPVWTAAAGSNQAYCSLTGAIYAVDPSAPAINFRVSLPSSWSLRAVHTGGGGMNGFPPGAPSAAILALGAATWGSDSGHSFLDSTWALNEEAMMNLAFMQMKKTRDVGVKLTERMYGQKPRFTYWQGGSQGGREGLTVMQRYPADYDGAALTVPIVNFSTLLLAPELIRIQEKPLANWVPPVKVAAIRQEFIRQCDKLDGLADGIINNYQACRDIFNVKAGTPGRNPWLNKRCPGNVDPNPTDNTASACFTDGQIETLNFIYSPYNFATPLANGVTSFGMWAPTTDPGGSGLLVPARYIGQEGADPGATMHSHLGILGVTGFLMKDLNANPLDYVEGGILNARRVQISRYLDATNPDLSPFYRRGGKVLITIGSNDSLASTGAQLDYYQSVLTTMTRPVLDAFARLWVLPQTGHGLSGNNHTVNGDGDTIPSAAIPNAFNGLQMVVDWVEKNQAPAKNPTVTAGAKSLPMCSYPQHPRYVSGDTALAASYVCAD